MKLTRIKVSRTFALLIIIVVSGMFLFPNILASISLYLFDKQYEQEVSAFQQAIEERKQRVQASIRVLDLQDSNLQACIEMQAARYADIHPDNSGGIDSVDQLRSLLCNNRDISSLEGMQGMKGLTSLVLSNNRITDISPLLPLHKLTSLQLDGNRVKDPRVLLSMKGLERVTLPNMSDMFCADIVAFVDSAHFKVGSMNVPDKFNCRGSEYAGKGQDIYRLLARQKAGYPLSLQEEIVLQEYKINQQKAIYNEEFKQ